MTRKQKSVTQKDIAARCGVCVMTVSCALRGDRSMVSEKTVERIQKVAREMGYRQDLGHAARRLKYTHNREKVINNLVGIDLGLDATNSPYFTRMLGTISKLFYEEDFALLSGWTSSTRFGRLPLVFRRGDVDGVFNVAGVQSSEMILQLLRDEPGFGNRPVVSILEPLDACPAVVIDDQGAGRALGEHLLERGHRQVFCLFGSFGSVPGEARLDGLRQAWEEYGLDPESSLQQLQVGLINSDDGGDFWRSFCELRAQYPAATALLVGNDALAVRAWEILRGHGVRIPDDFSLTGFDDTHSIPGPEGRNILTTIHVPLEEAAETATRMMLALIRNEPVKNRTVVLPADLVVRESVADV